MRPWLLIGTLLAGLVLPSGCRSGDEPAGARSADPAVEDPGPVHVHGLGVDPSDGALFIATHTGLFRAGPGERRARRVGDRYQDTMGFTVIGPRRFLGSGHPDGRDELPPFLGLVRSEDAGRTWRPVSLLGKRDFHALDAAGRYVYGFGSDFRTRSEALLVSDDGGRSWVQRASPERLLSLAVAPGDPERVLAGGEGGVYLSGDAGARWRRLAALGGLVAWSERRLVVLDGSGTVHAARAPGAPLRPVGELGGAPAALESDRSGVLYAALHDGTVKRSRDGGRSWQVRSVP